VFQLVANHCDESDMYPITGEDKIFCKFGYHTLAAQAS